MSHPTHEQLVNFVQWVRREAFEVGRMPAGAARDDRLGKFNVRCGAFDRLPVAQKLEAIDGSV